MNQWLQIRRLRGPAFLVLIGIMAMLAQWNVIGLHRSWPLILILAGLLSLAERAALSRVDPAELNPGVAGSYPGYPAPGSPAPPAASTAPSTAIATPQSHTDITPDQGRS